MKKTFDIILLNGFMYAVGIEVGTYHADGACVKQVSDEWIFSASYFGRILCPPILMTNDPSLGLPLLPAVEDDVNLFTLAQQEYKTPPSTEGSDFGSWSHGFARGYKAASAKKYTEEELLNYVMAAFSIGRTNSIDISEYKQDFLKHIESLTPKPKQVEVEMVDEVVAGSKTGLPFFSEPGKEVPRYSGLGRWVPTVDEKGFVKVLRWIY